MEANIYMTPLKEGDGYNYGSHKILCFNGLALDCGASHAMTVEFIKDAINEHLKNHTPGMGVYDPFS